MLTATVERRIPMINMHPVSGLRNKFLNIEDIGLKYGEPVYLSISFYAVFRPQFEAASSNGNYGNRRHHAPYEIGIGIAAQCRQTANSCIAAGFDELCPGIKIPPCLIIAATPIHIKDERTAQVC